MSGGVPAGELREHIAQIVARAYGGSLYPGLGTPGDYPTADADYRAADAILALPTPTPPIEGRDADVERVIAEAIGKADAAFGYSFNLTRLVDGEATHTLTMPGFETIDFEDRDEGYALIAERRNSARAAAIRAALQALGERG